MQDNKKVFLFGKFYTETSEKDLSKIKENEINRIQKIELRNNATQFEKNKNTYIEENFDNEESILANWRMYKSNILPEEKIKNKDVSSFTREQIEGLLASVPSTSYNTKRGIFTFINSYIAWLIDIKGMGINNPCDTIDVESVCVVNPILLNKKILSIEEVDCMCQEMYEKFSCNVFLPIIFARYGIIGAELCEMSELKYDDIDENRMVAYIPNKATGEIKEYPIDETFIKWINISKREVSLKTPFKSEEPFLETEYVLKRTEGRDGGEIASSASIYNNQHKLFKCMNMKRISFNLLKKSRQVELLLEERKHSKLSTLNILDVLRIFDPEKGESSCNTLVKAWETLTDEKIVKRIPRSTKQPSVEDEFALENAERFKTMIFG